MNPIKFSIKRFPQKGRFERLSTRQPLLKIAGWMTRLFTVALLLAVGCSKPAERTAEKSNTAGVEQNQEISKVEKLLSADHFDKVLSDNRIVLVDFYADWCGPCRQLKPAINQLARDYDGWIKVLEIDVDKFGSIARKFEITSIPNIMIFKTGTLERTLVGLHPKEAYANAIEKLL